MEPEMESLDNSTCSSELSSIMDSPSPPSSPLSMLSHSPSPPPELEKPLSYPSPPASQQTSQSGSPMPVGADEGDGPPPAKRRRVTKERKTEYLDLSGSDIRPEQQCQLDRLLRVLHKRRKIVVVAGAGISVSAGIPDFRSSTGLFTSLKSEHKLRGSGKDLFDASVYKDDSATTSFHTMVSSMSRLTKDARPTAFHHMLATLAQEDRLLRLYSQNVDGIDTGLDPLKTVVPLVKDSQGKWPKTVQLHGGLDKMVCSKCHKLSDFDADLFNGPTPPPCSLCEETNDIRTGEGRRSHGIGRLRPRMVLYNEHNPDDEAIGAITRHDLRRRPDAIIVVGTTLKVPGVKRIVREMCNVVRDHRDGVAIWINNDPPPTGPQLEDCWDIVVSGAADEVANRAALRHWNDPAELPSELANLTHEDFRLAAESKAEVILHCQNSVPNALPPHLRPEPLPSLDHHNNSFKPPNPLAKPVQPMAHGPADFSPMASRIIPVVPSIEKLGVDPRDSIITDGLLTPTKSSRGSSPKNVASINDRLKSASATALKVEKQSVSQSSKTAPAKKPAVSRVRAGKPRKATTKAQKPSAGLNQMFKASKPSDLKQIGKDAAPKTPTKLRHAFNHGTGVSGPMHPLSPNNATKTASPTKRPFFPGLDNKSTPQSNTHVAPL